MDGVTIYATPLYQPDLSGNEKRYVLDCLDSTWISSKGRYIEQFETRFSACVGAEYSVAVCNGTVALHLALVTLGIGPGDEVIVPTLTYIASVNAITYTGASPVFVDSLPDTWQMDPADVKRKITPRTKGIMAVHLYGHPCDMDALTDLAREHDVFLIEDCAEAFGTRYKGTHVGVFGDIATFSFYGNKTITTGEGGMVVTDDKTLFERAKHFKGQGLAAHREYWHDVVGYNYRMTNICAAIGLAQLERAEEFLRKKALLADAYRKGLAGLPLEVHGQYGDATHSYWMISILVKNASDRAGLRTHLAHSGIETRPLFHPVHTMPMYAARYQRHPVAENLAWRGINLPSWPGLDAGQVQQIVSAIRGYFEPRGTAPESSGAPVCEVIRPDHAEGLGRFFKHLQAEGVERWFHPHPLTAEEATKRASYAGLDFYCVVVKENAVIGYGMLRGWEDGYQIPSLGIVMDSAWRGRGYGRLLMEFLHAVARQRCASQIRLKTYADNACALALYRKLGYVFQGEEKGQLVGILTLATEPSPLREEHVG